MRQSWKPGEKATESGSYDLINSNGSKTGLSVKVKSDDRFPPADKDGQKYVKTSK